LGAGVVDGSVATDTARINRKDLSIAEHQIAVKDEHIILDPNPGQALRRAATPAERQRAACLPDPWLSRIAQFGIAAELLFERPQDMEWAVAADRVWVLQSRPHPTSTLARRRQGRLRRMRERPPTGCSMRGRPR
jgi:pyruvate,water dikinase